MQKLSKINNFINRLTRSSASIPNSFTSEYKNWRRRIEHLFSEFDTNIRNEYKHPSLESYSVGNIKMWGNIQIDNSGNITAHAGKNWFSIIKKEHCLRVQQLRTDLFDLFIKHFSEKPLTQELIKARKYIEANIDSLSKELSTLKEKNNWEDFNELLNQLTMYDVYFSKEYMPLPNNVKNKIYSVFWPND